MSWKSVVTTPFRFPGKVLGMGANPVVERILAGVIRHVGSAGGAFLTAHGLVAASDTQVVSGAVVTILSALASAIEKQGH